MPQAASTVTSTWLSDEAILGIEPDTSASAATPGSAAGAGNDSVDASDSEILSSPRRAENAALPREQREDASRAAEADAGAPALAQDADRAADTGREPAATPRDTSVTIHALPVATLEQLDAAYYSPEPAARAQFAQALFANDPAAFRAMFNEAARLLGVNVPVPEETRAEMNSAPTTARTIRPTAPGDSAAGEANPEPSGSESAPAFPVAAYRAFESATNDALSRDVRSAIGSTLEQVLPEGTAEGAVRRIADDIYTDIGKQLAADAQLSAQVGEILRGWRFGPVEQQQVNALLAGRARQLLPSAARRVIGEWTSSVLATARTRAARSEAASSRVDVGNAASRPAGNGEPSHALKPRDIDYARTSDDDILRM